MDDDLRYISRYGGTTSIRTLRRILRGIAALFGVFMVIILVTQNEEEMALFLMALGGMAFCLLLAAFPWLLRPRGPDGALLPRHSATREEDSEH